jgi:hypothetical protein
MRESYERYDVERCRWRQAREEISAIRLDQPERSCSIIHIPSSYTSRASARLDRIHLDLSFDLMDLMEWTYTAWTLKPNIICRGTVTTCTLQPCSRLDLSVHRVISPVDRSATRLVDKRFRDSFDGFPQRTSFAHGPEAMHALGWKDTPSSRFIKRLKSSLAREIEPSDSTR